MKGGVFLLCLWSVDRNFGFCYYGAELKMCEDNRNSVLLNTFTCGKKKLRVIFHKNQIVWDNEKPPFKQHTLPLEDIIAVENNYVQGAHPSQGKIIDPNQFNIHYAEKSGSKWKCICITFKHGDSLQISSWVKTLQNYLQKFRQRPKRFLLFVNPFGGKKNAMQIYEKYAKSLFQLAGVDVTVNVSQRKDQICDFLINHSLDMYDAVGCVGGDGTVSELFNGLVLRECKILGVDHNDIRQELPRPKLPVGIIPGGSTDTIAYCIYGTTDPTTAALNIIFGDPMGLDLVSVYDEHMLLRLYASVISYGYLGDVAYHSDRHRWMGPHRYDYSGFKKILSNKGYNGEVAICSECDGKFDDSRCYEKCQKCNVDDVFTCEKKEKKWKVIEGKFFMISGANISCACTRAPNGIAPYSHKGDGNVHLVMVRHTSVFNNIRLLLCLSSKYVTLDNLPFVETYCVREFCFRAKGDTSKWNCDGEVQHESNIRAKVRYQLLTVFSRGNPKPEEESVKKCCG